MFQSTLSRGERRMGSTRLFRPWGFNPRSRGESDSDKGLYDLIRDRFQSTLSRGERLPEPYPLPPYALVSIHALAGRATQIGFFALVEAIRFNPRSRGESDVTIVTPVTGFCMFQSTLSRGERRVQQIIDYSSAGFQSTLSRGERPTALCKLVR